jgi:Isochorismatase family
VRDCRSYTWCASICLTAATLSQCAKTLSADRSRCCAPAHLDGCWRSASCPAHPLTLDDDLLLSGQAQWLGDREIILYKPRWGAFFDTTLDEHLRANNVDTVVVAGCNYPNCPRTSIYEASERDYRAVLIEDAISGLYERGRTEMTNIGVTLYRTESVIAHLTNTLT